MDRPRSLVQVQDAGLWVRSIQPLGCPPVANTKSGAASPENGRDGPARWRLFDCQVSGGPRSRPGCGRAALWAAGFGLPPVHRLLQPVRDYRELVMFAVAVNHLLDMVVVVVVALVFGVLPVADPVAAAGNSAGNWRGRLSLGPDYCRSPRHPGDGAAVSLSQPEPVAHVATEVQVAVLKPVTAVAVPRQKDQALSHATRWRTPVVGLTQGARLPG